MDIIIRALLDICHKLRDVHIDEVVLVCQVVKLIFLHASFSILAITRNFLLEQLLVVI